MLQTRTVVMPAHLLLDALNLLEPLGWRLASQSEMGPPPERLATYTFTRQWR